MRSKTKLYIVLFVFATLIFLYVKGRCSLTCHRNEKFEISGICSDAAGDGASSKFVELCESYQNACGVDSASVVVHQIDGEYGLRSDTAESKLGGMVNNLSKIGCCNPQNQDDGNCTGNF